MNPAVHPSDQHHNSKVRQSGRTPSPRSHDMKPHVLPLWLIALAGFAFAQTTEPAATGQPEILGQIPDGTPTAPTPQSLSAFQQRLAQDSDRLENPDAWIRDESRNRADPHRPMSPEMQGVNPSDVDQLTAEDLAAMSLDHPLLKMAYASVFMDSPYKLSHTDPSRQTALADMRRRGESVSPVLLKLIEENKETRIESSILCFIPYLDTVNIDPFLNYARDLLRERTNSDVAGVASLLLAERGTTEDVELLEWLLEQNPYAEYDISKNLRALRLRLQPSNKIRPQIKDRPLASKSSLAGSVEKGKGFSDKRWYLDAQLSWIVWFSSGLVPIGILWLLIRKWWKVGGANEHSR